jgi:AraC-like DNA-binding protein
MANKFPRYGPAEVLDSSGIEINTFDELYAQPVALRTIYESHRASFFHIFCFRGAGNIHYVEGRKIAPEDDAFLIVNKDIRQRYARQHCRGEMILFQTTFLGRDDEKVEFMNNCSLFSGGHALVPLRDKDFAEEVDRYFSMMKSIYTEGDHMGQTEMVLLANWLHNLLIAIERRYRRQGHQLSPVPCSTELIQRFKTLVDEQMREQKQVKFYAEHLEVSEQKLSRAVQSTYGIAAKEYIGEKLLLEAIRLLENTTLNQGEIADQLGFDLTYFIKFFRKRTGTTPAKYRREQE